MPMSNYLRDLRAHVGHAMILMPGVSAVVVDDAGRLLLGRRSDTKQWDLLAGSLDPGEQPAAAIVREVEEESGVEVRVDRLVGVALHATTYPNGDQCQFLDTWFRCTVVNGEARVNDDESLEMGWFAPDALPPVDDWVRLRVDTTLADKPAAWYVDPGSAHRPEVLTALGF